MYKKFNTILEDKLREKVRLQDVYNSSTLFQNQYNYLINPISRDQKKEIADIHSHFYVQLIARIRTLIEKKPAE